MNPDIHSEADPIVTELAEKLTRLGWSCATAESCTGGWIAQTLTSVAGSSAWFEGGFVTYSNSAKSRQLGVAAELINRHGAVSEQVARAMAVGAVAHSGAQVSVSVTGVAGPDGGSVEKPVGTVVFGWCTPDLSNADVETMLFSGDRRAVRWSSVLHGLRGLVSRL